MPLYRHLAVLTAALPVTIAWALLAALCGCATTSYEAHGRSTARLRLVNRAPGSTQVLVTPTQACARGFGAADPGDVQLSVLSGSPAPVFGSSTAHRLGMPGAQDHPDESFDEVALEAGVPVAVRTAQAYWRGQGRWDTARCDIAVTLKLEPGADYELVEDAAPGCRLSLVRLTAAAGPVGRTPVAFERGPVACPAAE